MMQNGFRRIALAQGLLPDRLPSCEVSAQVANADARQLDATETDRVPAGQWDNDPKMLMAGAA